MGVTEDGKLSSGWLAVTEDVGGAEVGTWIGDFLAAMETFTFLCCRRSASSDSAG